MLETDAAQFDCETCEVRIAQAQVWPENREAWEMFQAVASRFVWDGHALGPLLAHLMSDWTEDAMIDRVQRCAVIYDILYPPPAPQSGD